MQLSDGNEIPQLGFGTYKLLGSECEEMVDAAIEIGYRHFDTASVYDNQKAVGKGIASFDRGELFLTSKLWLGDQTKETAPIAIDQILDELGCDYVDLLLIHWPDRSVPWEETFGVMMEAQAAGRVRSIGVSNFTVRHLEEALKTGAEIVTNQIELHPYFIQPELNAYCAQHDIVMTAYAPLAKGSVATDPILAEIGRAHGKSAAQVAIAWSLQMGYICIPKCSTPARAAENFDTDFCLIGKELTELSKCVGTGRLVSPGCGDFNFC